jgi:hypothetical protein
MLAETFWSPGRGVEREGIARQQHGAGESSRITSSGGKDTTVTPINRNLKRKNQEEEQE